MRWLLPMPQLLMSADLALACAGSTPRLIFFEHIAETRGVVVTRQRLPAWRSVTTARVVRLARPLVRRRRRVGDAGLLRGSFVLFCSRVSHLLLACRDKGFYLLGSHG